MRRLPSTDGVVVAVHDLGGEGPPLVLAHATGFCAGVLGPVAVHLAGRFRCLAVDLRGHGETQVPPECDYHWQGFADDVSTVVDALGLAPAFGMGHSAGGAALLMAAADGPGRFRGLWCYEAILWPDREAATPRARRLAEGARRRRATFPSREEAVARYASRPPFSTLDPSALRAFVDCAFADLPDGGVGLRCDPEVEARVYRMGVAHDGFERLGRVGCPVVVARGAASDAIPPEVAAAQVAALTAGQGVELPGLGHFGPLEDPAAVAVAVQEGLPGSFP